MSKTSITYSTELMQNYLQAEILQPEAGFSAIQTTSGTALLFSIGTDKALYATAEMPGARTGWLRLNLSAELVGRDFPAPAAAGVKTFAVAQAADGSIDVAMVVTDGTNDHLYLCLSNSGSDITWLNAPAWQPVPYDDPNRTVSKLVIPTVYVSEATDAEYIVVDTIRDPASAEPLIFRYYIDPKKAQGFAWCEHDVAIDVDAAKYQSCLGRKAGQGQFPVDGIYTAGEVDGNAQLVYAPLFDVFDPTTAPNPSRLQLPGAAVPDAVAACRNADNTSDLYVASAGKLYYFASTNQADQATGVAVAANDLLSGVRDLFAFLSAPDTVMIWGLNSSNQIFYSTCPTSQLTNPSGWSVPVPILSGVEQVSPFVNRANSANTFFAHTGAGELTVAVKSPQTTLWSFRKVNLPPPTTTLPAQSFPSYTTRIQVSGPDNQPIANTPVSLTASNVVSVYINHLYFVLGPQPIHVPTDGTGAITIVESISTLAGTRITVTAGDATVTINPMDKAFQKASSLTTADQLQNAVIQNQDGSTKPLVAPGTDPNALKQVAASNQQISKAYASVSHGSAPAAAIPHAAVMMAAPAGLPSGSILVDVGDFFSWLGHEIKSGFDEFVQLVEDAATGLWHIVVTIAGKVYHAILKTVEAVVGAVEWLYNAIKTAVEDVIQFVKFLFDVADLKRAKAVAKNLIKVFLNHQVDQILVIKGEFDKTMQQAEAAIDKWAGVGDWSGLGPDSSAPVNGRSTPNANHSAPGSLLSHHYQGNANNMTGNFTPSTPDPNPLNVFIQTLENEADIVVDTIDKLRALADNFTKMPLQDALKQLVAIIADTVLESARNVMDAVFDVLYDLAKAAVAALDTNIHIPVVSDILSELGIPEFSLLDIAAWVVAIPATLVYKIAKGASPFADNAETTFLSTVSDWDTLVAAFQGSAPHAPAPVSRMAMAVATPQPAVGMLSLSPSTASTVFTFGLLIGGFCSLISAIVSSFEAADKADGPWSIPSMIIAIVGGVSAGVAGALVPHDAIKNTAVAWISRVTLVVRILFKIGFSSVVQKKIKGSDKFKGYAVSDGRQVGAIFDAVMTIPALAVTIWHFVELGSDPAGGTRSIAIVDETSNLTSYIARVGYAVAVNTEGIPQAVAIGVEAVANVCTGGLQFAEPVIAASSSATA